MENRNKNAYKGKITKLAIAGISITAFIILTLLLASRFTGNLMYELAKYRQKSRSTDLSGIAKAIQLYSNNYNQYPQTNVRMICGSNMTELGKAILIYVNDFDQYPTPEKWCDILIEDCNVPHKTFRCPGAKEGTCNYALNKYITDLGTTADTNIVVLFETRPGWNQVGGREILTTENHLKEGCNVVFLDGHVEFIKAEDINNLKWKPDKRY
jgi:prepilin-type processing-associated H-X9-DG protein